MREQFKLLLMIAASIGQRGQTFRENLLGSALKVQLEEKSSENDNAHQNNDRCCRIVFEDHLLF
jgi:hypothetical protein